MAETAKMLSPKKTVILPDLKAGCSLADSCPPHLFRKFKEKYPDHKVVSYINCTAELKTLTDVCCTSTNAMHIINSFPEEQPIILWRMFVYFMPFFFILDKTLDLLYKITCYLIYKSISFHRLFIILFKYFAIVPVLCILLAFYVCVYYTVVFVANVVAYTFDGILINHQTQESAIVIQILAMGIALLEGTNAIYNEYCHLLRIVIEQAQDLQTERNSQFDCGISTANTNVKLFENTIDPLSTIFFYHSDFNLATILLVLVSTSTLNVENFIGDRPDFEIYIDNLSWYFYLPLYVITSLVATVRIFICNHLLFFLLCCLYTRLRFEHISHIHRTTMQNQTIPYLIYIIVRFCLGEEDPIQNRHFPSDQPMTIYTHGTFITYIDDIPHVSLDLFMACVNKFQPIYIEVLKVILKSMCYMVVFMFVYSKIQDHEGSEKLSLMFGIVFSIVSTGFAKRVTNVLSTPMAQQKCNDIAKAQRIKAFLKDFKKEVHSLIDFDLD